jgi:acid phosphatase (class A)
MRFYPAIGLAVTLAITCSNQAYSQAVDAQFLPAEDLAAERLVPPPPAPGSVAMAIEMARLKSVIATASAERKAEANADSSRRDPTVFNAAIGKDIAKLPQTFALLTDIQREAGVTIDAAKLYFKQPRPYTIDPSLPHCGKGGIDYKGYPSGHAGFGYSVGWALARLDPAHAQAVLVRSDDYALSREVCGVHFHADTEASRVIGTYIAERMLNDPKLAARVAAAKAELAAK